MEGLIQVAGVKDEEEALMLADSGVGEIGFPLRLAVHEEDLCEDLARRIIRLLPKLASGFLITYVLEASELDAFCRKLAVSRVQLHGDIAAGEVARLRALNPGLRIIKSLVVRGDNLSELEERLKELSPCVDAFITDTFDPSTGACGATGKTHDWRISRRLVELSPRPVILAGGLNPENVASAIFRVRPAGVDVHTGVEGADGRKDLALVRAFVSQARKAFAAIESSP